jgi:hypothetical protein
MTKHHHSASTRRNVSPPYRLRPFYIRRFLMPAACSAMFCEKHCFEQNKLGQKVARGAKPRAISSGFRIDPFNYHATMAEIRHVVTRCR